jgi:hypothetical protein
MIMISNMMRSIIIFTLTGITYGIIISQKNNVYCFNNPVNDQLGYCPGYVNCIAISITTGFRYFANDFTPLYGYITSYLSPHELYVALNTSFSGMTTICDDNIAQIFNQWNRNITFELRYNKNCDDFLIDQKNNFNNTINSIGIISSLLDCLFINDITI